jgi:alcohol dehydrogenase class IV
LQQALTLSPTVAALSKTLPAHDLASLASALPFVPAYFLSANRTHGANGTSAAEDVVALSAAIDKLVDELGLKSMLHAYSVPKADLTTIAQNSAQLYAGKPNQSQYPSADQILHDILERIY